MSKKDLTDKSYWDLEWDKNLDGNALRDFHFDKIISLINTSPYGSMIELGCVPGDNLIHIHNKLGLNINGIDYSDAISKAKSRMIVHGIDEFDLFQGDVFNYQFNQQYDLVFSMGLVEHFTDVEKMLQIHFELTKPDGYLLITLPNFRYYHYLTRYLADYDTLIKHNTFLMNVVNFKKIMSRYKLTYLYFDYFGDFDFWIENNKKDILNRFAVRSMKNLSRFVRKMFKLPVFRSKTSAFFSPWVVMLAKKTN